MGSASPALWAASMLVTCQRQVAGLEFWPSAPTALAPRPVKARDITIDLNIRLLLRLVILFGPRARPNASRAKRHANGFQCETPMRRRQGDCLIVRQRCSIM